MKQLIVLLFFTVSMFAASLQSVYNVPAQEINASLIYPEIDKDFTFYRFSKNNHQKSFSASTLIKVFAEHDVNLQSDYRGIVHFKRSASIDLAPLKQKIAEHYLSYYPTMKIDAIDLKLNSFAKKLPQEYTLSFKPNAHQHKYSTLKLRDISSKRRYFISYEITATIKLYKASHNINRGKILSPIDMTYTSVPFKRLKGTPIQSIELGKIRLKKRLSRGTIIYAHDLESLPTVLKNKSVNVRYINNNVHLEFQATALQDARIGEYIYVQKKDRQRLKVKVVGKNLVEIE